MFAIAGSIFCVCIELLLHQAGALSWDYPWWNVNSPWLIFLIGYLPFFVVAFWVFDMPKLRQKLITVGSIASFDVICLILFGVVLKWI